MPRSRKERFAQAEEYARRHGLPPGSFMEPFPYRKPYENPAHTRGTTSEIRFTRKKKKSVRKGRSLGKKR